MKRKTLVAALAIALAAAPACVRKAAPLPPVSRVYTIPLIDLASDASRRTVFDREPGQYLGQPTTVLLEDGRTIVAAYKGHGRGAIVLKRGGDGGLTWSGRLPVPENWATSLETPTIHRVVGPEGTKRLIVWSGLHPARLEVSEGDGATWTPLAPAGDWGGIVVMSALVELRPFGSGKYMAMFHDDGRFFARDARQETPVVFTLYKTFSNDGGLTWSFPDISMTGATPRMAWAGRSVLLRIAVPPSHPLTLEPDRAGRAWAAEKMRDFLSEAGAILAPLQQGEPPGQ